MSIEVSAPSNIALIKYMGKLNTETNRPTNSSLSYTLSHLKTFVRLTEIEGDSDQWRSLNIQNLPEMNLSEKSRQRFLQHFAYLKTELKIKGSYLVESVNNFPSDCGLASSASSFAALTKAAFQLAGRSDELALMAQKSQQGSGSSCRSIFEPWALWHSEGVRPLEFPQGPLIHQVIVVESKKKAVSSSEAHKRVTQSELFLGRPERAEKRLALLMQAFRQEDWALAFEVCWAEFWDMHALFETSQPTFGYMEPGTIEVLQFIRQLWADEKTGPLVTMDAGANVHFLYRQDQLPLASKVKEQLAKKYFVMSGESSI